MLESSYSKSVIAARRERRERLKVLIDLGNCCGQCVFFNSTWDRGHCLNPAHATKRWSDGNVFVEPAEVSVTQTCELFDSHVVAIGPENEEAEAKLKAIREKRELQTRNAA